MPDARKNPNEYDDEAFLKASNELMDAVAMLWEAGAEVKDIEGEFKNAMENVTA
jgi:hypothetical protein